jgi:predicted transcriptional regulator of viral defense system
MKILPSIKNLNQKRLATVLHGTQHTISVAEAATILTMSTRETAKLLSRFVGQGRLSRIKRGIYTPVPFFTVDMSSEDFWVIAEKLYRPCYVGALTAARYWSLTEQESHSVSILTTQKLRKRNQMVNGIQLSLRTISQQSMFGLTCIERGQTKISISDPSRTIIDFLVAPSLGGGIHNVKTILTNYLNSTHRNVELLYDYAKCMGNGAVLKRLGFLLEWCKSGEFNIISLCKMLKPTGNIKLDPQMPADKLITRWCLWVPEEMVNVTR